MSCEISKISLLPFEENVIVDVSGAVAHICITELVREKHRWYGCMDSWCERPDLQLPLLLLLFFAISWKFQLLTWYDDTDIQCKREGFVQKIKDEEGEGCNIHGSLEVNKVAGNFHLAPGKSFRHANVLLHDLLSLQQENYNVRSHSFFF